MAFTTGPIDEEEEGIIQKWELIHVFSKKWSIFASQARYSDQMSTASHQYTAYNHTSNKHVENILWTYLNTSIQIVANICQFLNLEMRHLTT